VEACGGNRTEGHLRSNPRTIKAYFKDVHDLKNINFLNEIL